MVKATQLRPGMIVVHDGELYTVFSVDHRTPGNKRASMQQKCATCAPEILLTTGSARKNFWSARSWMKSSTNICIPTPAGYHFMNTENYEQISLTPEIVGDAAYYLKGDMNVEIEFYEGKPIGVALPDTVDLQVIETEPTLQKATASAVMKPAKLETGLTINVPPFINNGDKIKVDTTEARYIQRAQ